MPHHERTIATPHADIRLTDTEGAGLPVLLLHGSASSRSVFDRQFGSQLAERHRLIAIDLPGHGQSSDAPDPAAGYTITGFAAAIAAVIDALAIPRAAIFGWSLGGHIAIELMSERPELVAGLMLTGAPPVGRGPLGMLRGFHASWDMLLASKERFTPRDVEHYAKLCFGNGVTPELLEAIRRADGRARPVLSRSMMRGECADQKRTVEEAQVPVAMVNGEHDPFVRLGYISGLNYATLWDRHCHVLPGVGHAVFREATERFNALLMRFAADAEAHRPVHEAPAARSA